MTSKEFNSIVEEFLDKTKSVLFTKEDEYSLTDDRFQFFKHEARIDGTTPELALYYCVLKHLTSFQDMIKSGEKYSKKLWFDKLGDITNYMILLYGLLADDNMFTECDHVESTVKSDKQRVKLNEAK